MPTTVRGGVPKVFRVVVPSTGVFALPFLMAPSNYIQVYASAATKMFFNGVDAAAGTNWVDISATAMFAGPASCKELWFSGAASVTVIVYTRV